MVRCWVGSELVQQLLLELQSDRVIEGPLRLIQVVFQAKVGFRVFTNIALSTLGNKEWDDFITWSYCSHPFSNALHNAGCLMA